MSHIISDQQKYDPWESKQEITDVRISILCSRYSMLSEWVCQNLTSPFWRIYHSRLGGGFISFEGKTIELRPNTIVIIPPNTAFSCYLKKPGKYKYEKIKSIQINDESEINLYGKEGMIDQMFVHFKMGFPYDWIKPSMYQFEIDDYAEKLIRSIELKMIEDPVFIDFRNNISIKYFVLYALQLLPEQIWNVPSIDERILNIVKHIDTHIADPLSNQDLSKIANLAKNSFARLFKENIKCTVRDFILQRRINHAITLFHHTNISIDQVAIKCGFYDRHHFSRFFKSFTGLSPANYRKKFI